MEQRDLELIEKIGKRDEVLANLWAEHMQLEQQLFKLERKPYLTTDEQVERNRIKKLKLVGRDRIESILTKHRSQVQARSNEC